MSDVRKPSPEEMKPPPPIEPDPGLDRLLQMMGSAVPPQAADGSGYFENLGTRTEDRINAHLTSKALGGGFPSTVDMRVAGVLVPKRRTPGWVYAVGAGGGLVALGLLGAIVYLLMTKPGLGGDESAGAVTGVEYVASRAAGTAAATAAPATVAVAAATTAPETAAESAPATGEEIAYAEDDETKRTMDAMGKGKPAGAGAAKKPGGKAAKGPGDDAPDGTVGTASAAVAMAKGSKVTDPSKAGAFDDDLTRLLEKKKDDAATAAPATAAATGKKLGPDDVKRVLATAKGRVGLCGKIEETDITVTFEINPDGSIGRIAAKPPHGSDAVGACVTGILKALKFPEHDDKPIKVSQSYSLKSEE